MIEASPLLQRTTAAQGFIGESVSAEAFLVSATPGHDGSIRVAMKLERELPSGFLEFRIAPGGIQGVGTLPTGEPLRVEGRIKSIAGRWMTLEDAKISRPPETLKREPAEIARARPLAGPSDASIAAGGPSPVSARRVDSGVTRYKTFWPRFWAGFVDGLVFLPVSVLNVYLSAPARGPLIIVTWSVISYSSYWLYTVLLHARRGQTLGKMATRVKVLDVKEERIPTLREAFLRDIVYIVLNIFSLGWLIYLVLTRQYTQEAWVNSTPAQILVFASFGWFLLEVATMITNEKRRALHDYIGGTVVVRTTALPTRV